MPRILRPEFFWPAFWLAVAVLFAGGLAAEYHFGRVTVGEGVRAPAKVVEAGLLPAFAMAPEVQPAPETVARPLFVPTRRPSPPAASAAVPTMKKGQFVLTGVTVANDAAFAFLKEVATGKTKSVRKGTEVNGITVDVVEPRRVVLKQGDETENLALNIQVPAKMAAAAAPTGAVPPAPGAPLMATGGVGLPGGLPQPPMAAPPPGTVPPAPGAIPGAPLPAPGTVPPGSASGAPAVPGMPNVPAPSAGRRRPWINAQ